MFPPVHVRLARKNPRHRAHVRAMTGVQSERTSYSYASNVKVHIRRLDGGATIAGSERGPE